MRKDERYSALMKNLYDEASKQFIKINLKFIVQEDEKLMKSISKKLMVTFQKKLKQINCKSKSKR